MYLLAFSILLLFSALNLKAQETVEGEMSLEGHAGSVNSLFLNLSSAGGSDEPSLLRSAARSDRPKPLLTEQETLFYGSMCRVLEDADFHVMAKVNLEDVVSTSMLNRQANCKFEKAKSKLDRKHVDFVVCSGNSLNIVAVARLDPASRLRPLQRLMQGRVDEVLDAAGIPVVHFPATKSYRDEEILSTLSPHLS